MLKIFLKTVYLILTILNKFIKILAKRLEFLLFLKEYIVETLNNAGFKIVSVDKSLDNKKTKYHSMRNYIFNR